MPRTRSAHSVTSRNESIEDNAVDALHSSVTTMQELLQRVVSLADEGLSLKELIQILEVVGKTSSRLSLVLRNQKQQAGGENLADFLNKALADVVQEMGADADRRASAATR